MVSGDGADADRSAAQPEERKTETTLTTRIRINIPGSRPIPPLVMRTPVADADRSETAERSERSERSDRPERSERSAGDNSAGAEAQSVSSSPYPQASNGTAEAAPADPAAPTEERTSDWFAPRKPAGGKAGPGGGGTNGAGMPTGSAPAAPAAPAPAPAAPGTGGGAGRPGAGRPGGVVGSMSVPGGARSGGTNGAGMSGATGGPVAPGHGGGTGSFDVTEALAASSRPGAAADETRRDDLPYFSENGPAAPQAPSGPTGGPVTGDGPLIPPISGESFTGPGAVTGPGGGPRGNRPAAGLSDDTAILTPQQPAPEQSAPGYGPPAGNVSGHTVTSGIPVVPPAANGPFGPRPGTDGPLPHTPPKLPEPAERNVPDSKPGKPKKKGRSKLVLLGVLVVVGGAGLYGAGLLMNHSDVPKGTTVLGVDIGGGTRDDAVKKLNDAFGERVNMPLKLSVDGKSVALTPGRAGLQFDAGATAGEASGSDYNPVSVIGTLFGQQRVVDPVMPVDEEKLQVALKIAGGGSGSVSEGGITFKSGKAVAVYGKPGKGIDAAGSAQAVAQAYRSMVETGTATPVTVATTAQQPTVSKTEVDREMKAFAEPAMSASVTVRTDAAHSVPLSPQKSLWKFLRVVSVNGKLVDKPDLAALKQLYGSTFDGVLITRANGQKTAVTPEDVYGALRTALTSKTNRIAVIDTDPS